MGRRLDVITIGQAPRPDILAALRAMHGAETSIALRGALDGLTREEVGRLQPKDGGDTLFTRLADGGSAVVSKAAITARVQAILDEHPDAGDAVRIMYCTGAFPGLAARGPIVFPSAVLAGIAAGLLPAGRLGLLLPLAEQVDQLAAKWRRPGIDVVAEPLLPEPGGGGAGAAAERLASRNPDLVMMDCMAYDQDTKDRVTAVLGRRVVLAASAVARIVEELMA